MQSQKMPYIEQNTVKDRILSKEQKKRTIRQNSAIHLWFNELSRELNNAGVDVKVMVSKLRVDCTPEMCKDIFRAIGKEKYGITSTKELTTKQVQDCYEEFNRLLATEGIHLNFPTYQDSESYLNSFVQ